MDEKMKSIWDAFKASMRDEKTNGLFRDTFRFGIEDIERVGAEKYIKAICWDEPEDVWSWKTDKTKIVICPDCGEEFGQYPLDAGICQKCVSKYYFKKNDVLDLYMSEGQISVSGLCYLYPEFREMFATPTAESTTTFGKHLLLLSALDDFYLRNIPVKKPFKISRITEHIKNYRPFRDKKICESWPEVVDMHRLFSKEIATDKSVDLALYLATVQHKTWGFIIDKLPDKEGDGNDSVGGDTVLHTE